jgi:tetratricopeptide (TPR) repeat protein
MAEALASLDRVVALDPRHAEGWALRGTLAGIRIGLHPATAVWRGPRVLHDNRRALELGAANPRVRYLLGTSAFFGPSVLGGKSRALEHFLAAGPLYERERAAPAGALEPRWGQASCLTFAARCYQEAGRPAEAEACVARALTVHPQARAMLDALQATGQAAGAGDREAGVREPGAGEVPDE